MSSSKPKPLLSQAFNDVLARMMQAEINEGGPSPATPCDTPVEVISHVHMTDPEPSTPGAEDTMPLTKKDFERTLTHQLDLLRDEIHSVQSKGITLKDAAKAKWHQTMADLDAKQKVAREKLAEAGNSSSEAWEHLREGVKHAWNELEAAVRKARSEF